MDKTTVEAWTARLQSGRYWVFICYKHEASGGLGDVQLVTNDLDKACKKVEAVKSNYHFEGEVYVFDSKLCKVMD